MASVVVLFVVTPVVARAVVTWISSLFASPAKHDPRSVADLAACATVGDVHAPLLRELLDRPAIVVLLVRTPDRVVGDQIAEPKRSSSERR